ncbi:MAG: 6-bladed beta-propeller [Tannerella sp.]|jgi:hypothetical protein|nr:6-bladed beta-propeller [Tannerella sp.]
MKKYLALFFLTCAACNNPATHKANEADSLIYIKIEKPDFSKLQPLLLSELVDSIQYIQLETSSDCLLPTEGGTLLRSDNLIFSAYSEKLYQFDTNGKFIRQIGSVGRGPGEFALSASRYAIDEVNRKIFVISRYNDCPLGFDFDGNYLGTVCDSTLMSCYQIISRFEVGDGHFVFVPYPGDSASQMICKPYELILYDYVNRKIVQSLTNRMVCNVDRVHHNLRLGLQTLQKHDGRLFYKSFYNDTLYVIGDGKIRPHAIVDLGKWKYPADLMYSSHPINPRPGRAGKILIDYMFPHHKYILFDCMALNGSSANNESFICKYDINTDNVSYHQPYIINNWDGGANIFMSRIIRGISAVPFPDEEMENKDIYFSNIKESELKHPEQREKFGQMQQRRKENDNPLLMTWRLK